LRKAEKLDTLGNVETSAPHSRTGGNAIHSVVLKFSISFRRLRETSL
jgi:hypothetical protein